MEEQFCLSLCIRTALYFAVFKTHLPRHINSRVFTDSCHCSRHYYFLSRQVFFNLYDENVFVPSQPRYRLSKKHVNAGIPFGSRVSIAIDGNVPNCPVSLRYFSHVEMARLLLFDCHSLVVGAPCRCFPDSANKHFP